MRSFHERFFFDAPAAIGVDRNGLHCGYAVP
jgi:hypothetical protein